MCARLFTPETARDTLPRVGPAAVRLRALYRALEHRARSRPSPDSPVDPLYFELLRAITAVRTVIDRHGVLVADLRCGRLDFPARRAGQAVLLTWEVGERRLFGWREVGAAAGTRHPVDEDGPWESG
jgi:hypothetical protein